MYSISLLLYCVSYVINETERCLSTRTVLTSTKTSISKLISHCTFCCDKGLRIFSGYFIVITQKLGKLFNLWDWLEQPLLWLWQRQADWQINQHLKLLDLLLSLELKHSMENKANNTKKLPIKWIIIGISVILFIAVTITAVLLSNNSGKKTRTQYNLTVFIIKIVAVKILLNFVLQ